MYYQKKNIQITLNYSIFVLCTFNMAIVEIGTIIAAKITPSVAMSAMKKDKF